MAYRMKRTIITALSLFVAIFSYGQDWSVKDIGIGILDTSEYDRVLKVFKRGDKWSEKEIYDLRYAPGTEKVFATWIEGPPTKEFLNSNGLPVWLCEYIITYPDKSIQVFGPFGFFEPGYSTMIINPSLRYIGKWKIEYFITHRDSKERRQIGTRYFNLSR